MSNNSLQEKIFNKINNELINYVKSLNENKEEKVILIKEVEKYISTLANMPQEYSVAIENINTNINAYEEEKNKFMVEIKRFKDENQNPKIKKTEGIFGTISLISGLGSIFSEDILKYNASKGNASTGTPIANLVGVAKENAIKAYIGGGSKATGGNGIEGGEKVIRLTKSTEALTSTLCLAIYAAIKILNSKKLKKEFKEKVIELNKEIDALGAKVKDEFLNIEECEIKTLIENTEALALKVNEKI